MPTWLKVLLALVVTGVLGFGLLVGSCVYWVNANKDKLAAAAKTAQGEGRAFGSGHSQGECIDEGFARAVACAPLDVLCEANVQMRVAACMPVARADGACAKIPAERELWKEALWGNEECTRRGHGGSQPCARYLQAVARACRGAGP